MAKSKLKNKSIKKNPKTASNKFTQLSNSPVWEFQKNYYKKLGKEAWRPKTVPNFITTNSFIANSYAQVMIGFVQDWQSHRKPENNDPIFIIELGAGSGRLAHYFLHHFFQTLKDKGIDQDVTYVMTDISEANIQFWRSHEKFQPFIEAGQLDFAYLDVWENASIDLLESGRCLTKQSSTAPIGVVANYVFDSVPTDLFCIKNGRIHERLVATSFDTGSDDIKVIVDNTKFTYQDKSCAINYYDRPELNTIIAEYLEDGDDFYFSIPVGAIRALEKMAEWTTAPLFTITGDFGDTSLQSAKEIDRQHRVVMNGAYTVRANYDAAARYCQANGGEALRSPNTHYSLAIMGFLFGGKTAQYQNLQKTFDKYIVEFGPDDFFSMKEIFEARGDGIEFDHMLAFLRLSKWDSKSFLLCFDTLNQFAARLSTTAKNSLRFILEKVEELYYFCDPETDVLLQIAHIRAKIGDFEKSLELFDHVTKLHGTTPNNQFFIGLLNWEMGEKEKAMEIMEEIITSNADFDRAKEALSKFRSDYYSTQ